MLNMVTCENSSKCSRNISKSARKSVKETYQQHEPDSSSSSSVIFFHTKHKSKARLRAEEEEEKLEREQAERAEKLQKFQADVQKRVSANQKMKLQKEIERGMKDINIARNVMRSCVGVSTSMVNHQKFLVPFKQTTNSPDEVAHNNSLSSQNQDVLTARSHDSTENHQLSLEEKVSSISNVSAVVGSYNGPVKIICEDQQPSNVNYFITGGMRDKKKLNKVLDNNCSGYSKNHVVSMVQHPDKSEVQEMKKQQTLQRTLSRKVFMDLEREKTREVERQNRQRMELFLLRNTREAIRKEIETSGREPIVHFEDEFYQEEYEFPERIQKSEDIVTKNSLQKASYARKLLALVQLLEEKCTKSSIPLPSLCPCGTHPTDPIRNNCANNCQFYKNPAEYCRAIKSLLSSMECSKNPRPFLT